MQKINNLNDKIKELNKENEKIKNEITQIYDNTIKTIINSLEILINPKKKEEDKKREMTEIINMLYIDKANTEKKLNLNSNEDLEDSKEILYLN